jgi:hypothetical protein
MSTGATPSKIRTEIYTVRGGDGVEYGPINISQLQELVKQSKVKATTMIHTQSAGRWHLAASIVEVRALLRQYNPTQNSALNKIRAMGGSVIRDSRQAHMAVGRVSTVRVKKGNVLERLPFFKRLFHR